MNDKHVWVVVDGNGNESLMTERKRRIRMRIGYIVSAGGALVASVYSGVNYNDTLPVILAFICGMIFIWALLHEPPLTPPADDERKL